MENLTCYVLSLKNITTISLMLLSLMNGMYYSKGDGMLIGEV